MSVPLVERCSPEEREEALGVLYQRIPDSLRPGLIAEALSEALSGRLDLSGLWIARGRPWPLKARGPDGRIIGALLTQELAGRAAAIWAPEVRPSWHRSGIAVALVRSALLQLQVRGFQIVQAVLDTTANRRGAVDLAQGGMRRVTELLYLERETRIPLRPPGGKKPPALNWQPFRWDREAEFRAFLKATYSSSLDMPELEGVRSLDDVIAGHRATGQFLPERWQLARVPGEPDAAAILLLAEIPDRDVWEVAYLGLTPPARGRGLGHAAIAHALELARPHTSHLELAVDARNHPAIRLYRSTGFVPFDRRSVYLVVFPAPDH